MSNGAMDWDQYGHCVNCHQNLIFEQVIDGHVQQRWSPQASEVEFLLSDKSRMRVCMCKTCKDNLKEEDHPKIMDCVVKGWKREIDILAWDKDKKDNYMNSYSKKEIVVNSETIPNDDIDMHIKKFTIEKEKKEKVKK